MFDSRLAARVLPVLIERTKKHQDWSRKYVTPAMTGALILRNHSDSDFDKLMLVLIDDLIAHDKVISVQWAICMSAVVIASYLCNGDEKHLRSLMESCIAKKYYFDTQEKWECLVSLSQVPRMLHNVRVACEQSPGSCANFFTQTRLASRMGISAADVCGELDAVPVECDCEHCAVATTYGEEIRKHWRGFAHAQTCVGASHELPQSIVKLIETPEKFSKELHYLEKEYPPASRPPGIAKRIEKLRFYKQFPMTMKADIELHLRRELEKTEAQAYLSAATKLIENAIERKCTADQLQTLGLTRDQLFDLLVLRCSISKEKNRTELKRLLAACMRGDLTWPLKQPANRAFMRKMSEKGMNVEAWVSPFPASINAPHVHAGVLKISIEQNPIEVLKMGVYFDTCLSLDGINAFSSIANATDVNKRVIYVRDAAGKVVARKLIALGTEWKLLGYNTYVDETWKKEQRDSLAVAVDEYARTFAEACRIELGEGHEVEILVSKSWYDDGTMKWTDRATANNNRESAPPLDIPLICFGEKKRR